MSILLLSLALATTPSDVPHPAADHWVSDVADVLSPDEEARIDAAIDEWRESVPVEVAVVTLPSVDGTPKAFATDLFNTWGIGDAETDNGFLLLLVMDERRLEIEIGTGMNEMYSQEWLIRMQERHMVPSFRQGEFGQGMLTGLEQLVAHQAVAGGESAAQESWQSATPVLVQPSTAPARPHPRPRPRPARRPPQQRVTPQLRTGILTVLMGAAGGGTTILGGVAGIVLWRRRRRCPQCDIPMTRLDDRAEDAHLTAKQISEERLGSANWEVRICPECQFSRTFDHGKWFSGYTRCGSCDTRALTSRSTTLVAATESHGGTVEVSERCHHCPHTNRYTYKTAALPPPSDDDDDSYGGGSSYSSSSSSSSFGGGSSSGGGAGSSW